MEPFLEARTLWGAWHSMCSETDVSGSQLYKWAAMARCDRPDPVCVQHVHAASVTPRDLAGSGILWQQTSESCTSKSKINSHVKEKLYSQMLLSPKRGQIQVYPMKANSALPWIPRMITLISSKSIASTVRPHHYSGVITTLMVRWSWRLHSMSLC